MCIDTQRRRSSIYRGGFCIIRVVSVLMPIFRFGLLSCNTLACGLGATVGGEGSPNFFRANLRGAPTSSSSERLERYFRYDPCDERLVVAFLLCFHIPATLKAGASDDKRHHLFLGVLGRRGGYMLPCHAIRAACACMLVGI